MAIEDIMQAAGLTRGGFYRHFDSKQALFRAALGDGHDFVDRLRARPPGPPEALVEQGVEVVRGYLDPRNRDAVGRGCSIAALASDTARARSGSRRAYAGAVRALADELARGLEDPVDDDPRALAATALCVGGLLLSRAVGDAALADAISAAAAAAAEGLLRGPPEAGQRGTGAA